MVRMYISILIVLGYSIATCCQASNIITSGMMEKLWTFDNNLPLTSVCYIANLDDMSAVHCNSYCLTRRDVCMGVVFNREQKTCKLLKCNPKEIITTGMYETGKWDLFMRMDGVCNHGWVKHLDHCYFFNDTWETWLNAKGICEEIGGSLASLQSFEEVTWMEDVMSTHFSDFTEQSKLMTCDFENSAWQTDSRCGLVQSYLDDFDWSRHSGSTGSLSTGPSFASRGSYYLYIETTSKSYNDRAVLMSASLNTTDGGCLRFDYHMFGTDINTLIIKVSTFGNLPQIPWVAYGNKGNHWNRAQVSLPRSSSLMIDIEATAGISVNGDIAIDNIVVFKGDCCQVWLPLCWIGGIYNATERTYVWISDYSTLDLNNWCLGEPQSAFACVSLQSIGIFQTYPCGGELPFICEVPTM